MGAVFWNFVVSSGRSRPVNGTGHFASNVKTLSLKINGHCVVAEFSCLVELHIGLCHQNQKLHCVVFSNLLQVEFEILLLCADWQNIS